MDRVLLLRAVKDAAVGPFGDLVGEREFEISELGLRPEVTHRARLHGAVVALGGLHAADERTVFLDFPGPGREFPGVETLPVEQHRRIWIGRSANRGH